MSFPWSSRGPAIPRRPHLALSGANPHPSHFCGWLWIFYTSSLLSLTVVIVSGEKYMKSRTVLLIDIVLMSIRILIQILVFDPDRHQYDADPHAGSTQLFINVWKWEKICFTYNHRSASTLWFILLVNSHRNRWYYFQYLGSIDCSDAEPGREPKEP